MTDAEHADLSRRLALALGYPIESVTVTMNPGTYVFGAYRKSGEPPASWWIPFDYRDPTVAFPLLKLLGERGCYPIPQLDGTEEDEHRPLIGWDLRGPALYGSRSLIVCQSLEEAIARAVIVVKEKT